MTKWPEMTLGEICAEGGGFIRTGPFGSQLHQSDYVDDPAGIPVLMPKDMAGGRIDLTSIARIDVENASRLSQHLLAAGDVALSRRGDVGRSACIASEDLPVLCGTGSMRVHPGTPSAVRPDYLRYFFRSRLAIDYLEGQAVGATMPNLNAGIVTGMPVPVLPLVLQEVAASALSTLDDLIEVNQRRIELLEQMAKALYREWFVLFRYPGHEDAILVNSPLGPLPEGWLVKPLIALASLTMGQSPRSEHYNTASIGMPFHQGVTDYGRHFPRNRKYCSVDGHRALDGDVLISVRAPVGRLNVAANDLVIGRGLAAARSRTERQALLFRALADMAFAEEDSMGGGTIYKAIGKKELEQVRMVSAPPTLEAEAEAILADNMALIRALTFENRALASSRDLLLPKLVAGQIDISGLDLHAVVKSVA